MSSTKQSPSASVLGGPLAKLVSAGSSVRHGVRRPNLKRWGLRLLAVVVALVVVWELFLVAVRIITANMWFDSVGNGSVYRTLLEAQIVLFCVFGVIAGLVGGVTVVTVRRVRSPLYLSPETDTFRWTFRKYEPRFRRLIVLLAVVIPAVLVGRQAAAGARTYLLWRHAAPWGSTDPLFHKDISFFVEVFPFHRLVVTLLLQAVAYGLWIAVISGYWYGTWRLRRGRQKITRDFTTLISLLLAGYLVLKAGNYWLARYALTTSQRGPVTGASYADVHAALPSKYVLMSVALVCAAGLLASAFLRVRVRGLVAAVSLMVAAVLLAGVAWPSLLYHFREAPSAAKLDLGEIAHNQKATLDAFGLSGDVTTVPYNPSTSIQGTQLVSLAKKTAQVSLIDPNQLSPTWNVEQQLQAYYGFKSTLDNSHYQLDGRSQDVVLAARELQSGGIPHSSWVNRHLVYTHGYGIVAAPTTRVDSQTESPVFLDGGIPPSQEIPVRRPQIYFGQAFTSPSYSIVGQPAGSHENLEFDHPGSNGSSRSAYTTYRGNGGIPIGSALRRFLFAVRFRSPNIFFSSELNKASQLLMVRSPRARVAKVAPWLTLDGDIYPAVVNGRIKWIVDGYTSSKTYPYSQLVNLHKASATTLTAAGGASVAQPNSQVNYLHNSVKAVVDAYTGKVSLYAWNQQQHADPLLHAWESAFPGLVKPQSSISSALLPQLRYPTDLFNVQRYLLAKYHVSQPASFYSGNDFWTVPSDPTVAAAKKLNAKKAQAASPPLPSKYMSLSPKGYGSQRYSLSSPMVTLNGRQLAAFVSVDSQPGPNYGKITVLNFPSASGGESPIQVQNDIESDTRITEALTLQRGGKSKVELGDLQAIPVAGRMLYVEPVYTRSSGSASFPVLRHVIALYGNGNPSFETSLNAALQQAIHPKATATG